MVEMFILLVGKSSSVFVLFISDSLFPNYPIICRVLYRLGLFIISRRRLELLQRVAILLLTAKKKKRKQNSFDCLKCHYGEFFLKLSQLVKLKSTP